MCYEREIGPDEDGVTFQHCPVYSKALIWRLLKRGGCNVGCGRADLGGLRRSVIFLERVWAALNLEFLNEEIVHLACQVSNCGPALEQMSCQWNWGKAESLLYPPEKVFQPEARVQYNTAPWANTYGTGAYLYLALDKHLTGNARRCMLEAKQ